MNKYAQLHEYLVAALDDLRGRIPDGDRARITIQAVIDYEGEYEIKYKLEESAAFHRPLKNHTKMC